MKNKKSLSYTFHDPELCYSHGRSNAMTCGHLFCFIIAFVVGMAISSCSTPTPIADEIVFGAEPDQISAKIDGLPITFNASRGTDYFGIHAGGVSGANTIGLDLGGGSPGKYMWTGPDMMGDISVAASWNGAYAIKGLGYLNIIQNERACVRGTFEFVAIDPTTRDTIRVTDGTFIINYITTD